MDALQLLKSDHQKVKAHARTARRNHRASGEDADGDVRATETRLDVHETIEEEILYPALEGFAKTKDITLEAFEEHHVVDQIVAELETTPVTDETWGAKLTVDEGEPRASHRGRGRRDVQAGSSGHGPQGARRALGEQMDARKKQLSEDVDDAPSLPRLR